MSPGQTIRSIWKSDPEYPELLSEIEHSPSPLFVRGLLPSGDCVSVVGTRKASSEGKHIAKRVSFELASRGICIVSGLAFGIDEAAHSGALEAGGRTVAVLANGLDSVYPKQHERLAENIVSAGGCLVSEYPEGTPPFPGRFLERNRIISGFSKATVVIEAPARSGSIATANHAACQGRDVFVFPGRYSDKNYEGSHTLIRNGARLVASIGQILEDLGFSPEDSAERKADAIRKYEDDEFAIRILSALEEQHSRLNIDKLSELTTLEPRILAERLTLLEIDGVIEEQNGSFRIKI